MTSQKFFSKSNLYPALWGLILAFIAFLGGTFWQKITGPNEVVIVRKNNDKDTVITVLRIEPDSTYFVNLLNQSSNKFLESDSSSDRSELIEKTSKAIAFELQKRLDKQLQSSIKNTQAVKQNGKNPFNASTSQNGNILETYKVSEMNKYGSANINKLEFEQNETIKINLQFLNKEILSEITPVKVNLLRSEDGVMWEDWIAFYDIIETSTDIEISSNFKPHMYYMNIGFYLKNDIDDVKTLYNMQFKINIKPK